MAKPVGVRVERTPNPNSLKFTVDGTDWGDRPRTVARADQAAGLPLAPRLLAIPGVRSLFFLRDFVTVTRQPDADWEAIADAVVAVIHAAHADEG